MIYNEIPLPVSIAFEPINLCNAKCFCCPYTTLSEDKTYHGVKMTRKQIALEVIEYLEEHNYDTIAAKRAVVQPKRSWF